MAVRAFKLFWNLHKWTGIVAAAFFLMIATTGLLLLLKKRIDWIQPPAIVDMEGGPEQYITIDEVMRIVLAQNHADFQSIDDVDRFDLRPRERVYKVVSKHNYSEIQVGAISGQVLSVDWRPSDLIESIHDGSFVGGWMHDWVMPIVPVALVFLVFSGIWLWIEPIVRRRKRRREATTGRSS